MKRPFTALEVCRCIDSFGELLTNHCVRVCGRGQGTLPTAVQAVRANELDTIYCSDF